MVMREFSVTHTICACIEIRYLWNVYRNRKMDHKQCLLNWSRGKWTAIFSVRQYSIQNCSMRNGMGWIPIDCHLHDAFQAPTQNQKKKERDVGGEVHTRIKNTIETNRTKGNHKVQRTHTTSHLCIYHCEP